MALVDELADVLREHNAATPNGKRCRGCDRPILRDLPEHQAFELLTYLDGHDLGVYADQDVNP